MRTAWQPHVGRLKNPYDAFFGHGIDGHTNGDTTVVTGDFNGYPTVFGEGTEREISFTARASNGDAFVATYQRGGDYLCAWALQGEDNEDALDAVMDAEGGIIVGGQFQQQMDIIGPDGQMVGHIDGVEENFDAFILRLAP